MKILKDASGGMYIILEGLHPGKPELVAIGYCYNSKVTLCFVVTKNAGSTWKGFLHRIKFADLHSNTHVRLVNYPSVISEFFEVLNAVNKHNQVCQYELALEKK